MKKFKKSLLAAGAISILLLAGCGKTDIPGEPKPTAAPEPTPVPTATPTPIPTPIPYEKVTDGSVPEYRFASDYQEIRAALSAAAQPFADDWTEQFVSAGSVFPASTEVSRLREEEQEGDIIACGDSCLYIIDSKELLILSIDGREDPVLSRTAVGIDWTGGESDNGTNVSGYEKTPLAVFPLGDTLAVVSDWYGYNGSAEALTYMEYTSVDLFRISDPAAPVFLSSFGQDGIYKSSRMTDDGSLFLLTEFIPSHIDSDVPDGLVPCVYTGGSRTPLAAEKVLLTENAGGNSNGYAVLGKYSLSAPGDTDVIAAAGLGIGDITLLQDGPRFVRRRWEETLSRTYTENGKDVTEYAVVACTDVFRLNTGSGPLSVESVSVVNGWLPDASSLRAENGQLWYTGSVCQGLFTRDAQGAVQWRETVTGTRIACIDLLTGKRFGLEYPGTEAMITWVGLLKDGAAFTAEDGRSFLFLRDGSQALPLSEPLTGGTILPWGEDGYLAFFQTDTGTMTLSVRDTQLRESAVRSFGSDHSNTLQNQQSYFTDAGSNLLGFAADDSYCLYGFTAEDGLFFRESVFLKDWAWNARAFRAGDRLIVADTSEVFLYDLTTLELLTSYDLRPDTEE